jgi:hypothetical protein
MRRFVLVAFCVTATFTGSAAASRSIIGGSAISIAQAPWTVYLYQASGTCSGAILDATHVVTAGHCVFDANGVAIAPSALTVYAGISEAQGQLGAGGDTDWQMSTASAIRVHPGYSYSENANPDDVAVVSLSTPLTLGGSVQAVSLPASGSPYPAGASAVDAGFGLDAPGTSDGLLNELGLTVDSLGDCGGLNQIIPGYDATSLCASSPSGATCSGDSGSGLVSSGTLIGIVQAGPDGCAAGSHTIFAYVDSPEILDFIQGNDHPPTAPRESDGEYVAIAWLSSILEVGVTLSCDAGSVSGSPTYSYVFTNATTGQVIQQGSRSTLVTTKALQGQKVSCNVIATNAGGTTVEPSGVTPAIKAATEPVVVEPGAKPHTTAKPKLKTVTSAKPATPKGTLPKTAGTGSTSTGVTKSATAGSAAAIAATARLGELTELHAKGITVDCATPAELSKLAGATGGPKPTGYAVAHGKTLYLSATLVCKPLTASNSQGSSLTNATLEALLVLSREYGATLGLKTGPAVECYAAKTTLKWVQRSTFGALVDTRARAFLLDNKHQPAAYALAPSCKL